MNIPSPTKTVDVELRDLDIRYPGETCPITLQPEDDLEIRPDALVVRYKKNGEEVTLERAHILWWSLRKRVVTRPVENPKK